MKFKLLLTLVLSCTCYTLAAQDFEFGALKAEDVNYKDKMPDSNANAIVLREFGTARMVLNDNTNRLEIVFDYHVRIKIINDKGFDRANIVVPLYKDSERQEIISEIKASTFNLSNTGYNETAFDVKKVFQENKAKYTMLAKFTLPNIKAGSIIEYRYKIVSPNIFNFRTWEFQEGIPKVYSEFLAIIPGNYNYNVALRGPLKLTRSNGVVENECIRLGGVPIDCSKMTYVMENIPAFVEEDYMTAASNFISAIYFELSDVQNTDGTKQNLTKTWKDIDNDLIAEKQFGGQMKRKDLFKDIIPVVITGAGDELAKAKAIYAYIKKEIRWNQYYGKYSEDNIKKSLESHQGNVGDINLSLIAALSAANLDAEAVLVSTRDNGYPNKIFPVVTDFNYVIAKVNIGDKSYLLDATDPLLPFGLLPLRCINDQGRVINLKKPSYWVDLKNDLRSNTTYFLNGELKSDGKITGTINISYQGYPALNKRREIKKYNTVEEYVDKLDEAMPKISLLKHTITNIDSAENILTESYEVEIEAFEQAHGDKFSLNPFLLNRISKNPFNLNSRTYPVDMGAASTELSVVNIKLGDKYLLEAKPADVSIALPDAGGRYLLSTAMNADGISINQRIQLNHAIYAPEDYLYLKEFYSRIIQSQKTDFVLKKQGK